MSESEMLDELLGDARERMTKSVESIRHEFGSVRTGRASPALLDRIMVDYYRTIRARSRRLSARSSSRTSA